MKNAIANLPRYWNIQVFQRTVIFKLRLQKKGLNNMENKRLIIISLALLILSITNLVPASALSFKLGGLFGTQNSFTRKYSNTPIVYIEQKIYNCLDADILTSVGLSYLDSTNCENWELYGYFQTSNNTFPLTANPTDTPVYGAVNAKSKLLLIPFKIQAVKYYTINDNLKTPKLILTGGLTVIYYREKYERFTDAEDALKSQKILGSYTKNGVKYGMNLGIGLKFSEKLQINSEYNIVQSTGLKTGLNNCELYFRIVY